MISSTAFLIEVRANLLKFPKKNRTSKLNFFHYFFFIIITLLQSTQTQDLSKTTAALTRPKLVHIEHVFFHDGFRIVVALIVLDRLELPRRWSLGRAWSNSQCPGNGLVHCLLLLGKPYRMQRWNKKRVPFLLINY